MSLWNSSARRAVAGTLATAFAALCLEPGSAAAIARGLGAFTLGSSHDLLLSDAESARYRVERDLGATVSFAPPLKGDAEVIATLYEDAVIRLKFVWPGTPKQDDFDAVVGEYIAQLGTPADTTLRDGVLQVSWHDDSTMATVRASIGSKRTPLQGNLYHRPAFESRTAPVATLEESGDAGNQKPKATTTPRKKPSKSPRTVKGTR